MEQKRAAAASQASECPDRGLASEDRRCRRRLRQAVAELSSPLWPLPPVFLTFRRSSVAPLPTQQAAWRPPCMLWLQVRMLRWGIVLACRAWLCLWHPHLLPDLLQGRTFTQAAAGPVPTGELSFLAIQRHYGFFSWENFVILCACPPGSKLPAACDRDPISLCS